MPQFAYKALQLNGALVEGSLDASNRQEAMRQVEILGLKPIKLAESGATSAPFKSGAANDGASPLAGLKLGGPGKITSRMLENFTRLLASLLAAGVPFSRALVIIHREASAPIAKAK